MYVYVLKNKVLKQKPRKGKLPGPSGHQLRQLKRLLWIDGSTVQVDCPRLILHLESAFSSCLGPYCLEIVWNEEIWRNQEHMSTWVHMRHMSPCWPCYALFIFFHILVYPHINYSILLASDRFKFQNWNFPTSRCVASWRGHFLSLRSGTSLAFECWKADAGNKDH